MGPRKQSWSRLGFCRPPDRIWDQQDRGQSPFSMALDHYVSQVHLRKFCSAPPEQYLYGIHKSSMKHFRTSTRAVCRIEEGSTNHFLKVPRAVEQFLKGIEPRYDVALANLRAGRIDAECIYVIAGFAAY